MTLRNPPLGWLLLGVLLLAGLLIPWLLFDRPLTLGLTQLFAAAKTHRLAAGTLVVALLAADVVLPVPSSLIGVFSGGALGFIPGATALWCGLMAGCLVAYWLGGRPGRRLANRVVGGEQLASLESVYARLGPVVLVITRAVPVLAEASVIAAGAARMPYASFLLTTSVANVGVALAWAGLGDVAGSGGNFIVLFLGLALLPALGWVLWQRARRAAARIDRLP